LAVLLHQRERFRRLFQVLFTMPYLVSPLVAGYLWSLLLSPLFGPVNALLRAFGLDAVALPSRCDRGCAVWVVMLVSAWQCGGYARLVYAAALGAHDSRTHVAARLAGARAPQPFWHETLLLLTPLARTVSVPTFIFSMNAFPIP